MPSDPNSKPSFSTARKWSIGFNVLLLVVIVLAVVVMVNYLSRDYFVRWQVNTTRKFELSPRTVNLVKSLTNQVKITIYYDKDDPLYTTVASLIKEYQHLNSKISVQTVDFNRDFGAAQKIKTQYNLGSVTDKNLVIFDSNGQIQRLDGKALAEYSIELEPGAGSKENSYRVKTTAFKGEMMFTSALLSLASPKNFKAYFLQGHGEHRIENGDQRMGFLKFKSILQQYMVQVETLSLLGTNPVPMDCNLLVIAGPTTAIPDSQLSKIEQYLNQGGRLLALFNSESVDKVIGLEKILAGWGIAIGDFIVADPENSNGDSDVTVMAFTKHPLVNPLTGNGLYLIRPRPIGRLNTRSSQAADAAHVEPVAYSGPKAYNETDPAKAPHQFPFMVAVEKGAIKGVITERGSTRMIVAGDSLFLANGVIDSMANRDFAGYAVNWLLDRKELLEGLGPKPLAEYKLLMTQSQLQRAQWLLLAAMPGAVLLIGGMVWLRRKR